MAFAADVHSEAKNRPDLLPGMVLIVVNEESVRGWTYSLIVETLVDLPHPLTLAWSFPLPVDLNEETTRVHYNFATKSLSYGSVSSGAPLVEYQVQTTKPRVWVEMTDVRLRTCSPSSDVSDFLFAISQQQHGTFYHTYQGTANVFVFTEEYWGKVMKGKKAERISYVWARARAVRGRWSGPIPMFSDVGSRCDYFANQCGWISDIRQHFCSSCCGAVAYVTTDAPCTYVILVLCTLPYHSIKAVAARANFPFSGIAVALTVIASGLYGQLLFFVHTFRNGFKQPSEVHGDDLNQINVIYLIFRRVPFWQH